MSDPYRDKRLSCPACNSPLREFRTRYACDSCDGMMLTLPDLAQAIHDLTSVMPAFEYRDAKPGKRSCPHCATTMSTCKLTLVLESEEIEPKPVLDRCDAHGIWFDGEELAGVFEKIATKGYGGGVGRKGPKGGGGAIPSGGGPKWEWEGALGTRKR